MMQFRLEERWLATPPFAPATFHQISVVTVAMKCSLHSGWLLVGLEEGFVDACRARAAL
jgi:hypothetical protein